MSKTPAYLLKTGEPGARRLALVEAAYGPASARLITTVVDTKSNIRVADVGCGPAALTPILAHVAGPNGEVIGIDEQEEQLELARARAKQCGLMNVRWQQASAYETGLPTACCDVVYCRFLLLHLTQPIAALREMVRVLKPGGTLICEDLALRTAFTFPDCDPYNRAIHEISALTAHLGTNWNVGLELVNFFKQAGITQPSLSTYQPVYVGREPEKNVAEYTLRELSFGLAQQQPELASSLDARADAVAQFVQQDGNIVALPMMFQVWGKAYD